MGTDWLHCGTDTRNPLFSATHPTSGLCTLLSKLVPFQLVLVQHYNLFEQFYQHQGTILNACVLLDTTHSLKHCLRNNSNYTWQKLAPK